MRQKVNVTLPEDLVARLKEISAEEMRPFSRTVELLLKAGLNARYPKPLAELTLEEAQRYVEKHPEALDLLQHYLPVTEEQFSKLTDENPEPEEEQEWQRRYDTP